MLELAHGAPTSGGPNAEFLIVAGALAIVGIILFVQKSAHPGVSAALVVIALAMGVGSFTLTSDEEPAATHGHSSSVFLRIIEPDDGATVDAGKKLPLEVSLSGATLSPEDASDDEIPGHIHVFVDGETISMPTTLRPKVKLAPGEHELAVEFVDTRHLSLDPKVVDQITVTAE